MNGETPPWPEAIPDLLKDRRAAALYTMAIEGWAQSSSGNTHAPTGWFARVSNSAVEMDEIGSVFEVEFTRLDVKHQQLLGHFLLVLHDEQPLQVHEVPDEDMVATLFNERLVRYEEWRQEHPSDG